MNSICGRSFTLTTLTHRLARAQANRMSGHLGRCALISLGLDVTGVAIVERTVIFTGVKPPRDLRHSWFMPYNSHF